MSGSEGRSEPAAQASPQASGVKVLETLKKHVFEHAEASSKSMSSREVCSSFSDLTVAVFSTSQRANSGVVVSGAVELLVHACSSQDRAIRLAGQENLYKLVKGLQSTHLSRLQQDLFHELKKNGSARSVSVALEVFAAIFPATRPSRRQSLAQSLLPVLLRLLARVEEALHEALQEALTLILPTMTPFLSLTNTQLLMSALLERLPDSIPSYRRMAASTLHLLTIHSKSPEAHTHWLIGRMLSLGCHGNATDQICLGVLLTLQNMAGCHDNFTLELLQQVYGFVLSCMLYRHGNTVIAAMETMNALLTSPPHLLTRWLMTPQPPSAAMATQFWSCVSVGDGDKEEGVVREGGEGGEGGERGEGGEGCSDPEARSLGEEMKDGYFDSDQEPCTSENTPASESPVTSDPKSMQCGYLATDDELRKPLPNLVKYIQEVVLPSNRVSAVSVGLACLTACADLVPSLTPSLSPYLSFISHNDPKLKSRSAKLLAVVVRAVLRDSSGEASWPLVSEAASSLHTLLSDDSPVVLKAVCESLRVCLPSLATSHHPQLAVELVQSLLTAAATSSYWLAKVELLRTLACLPLTALALSLPSLPHSLLSLCVFPLLGDADHRVRNAAAEAIGILVPSLQMTSDPVLAHANWEVSREFPSLHSHTPQISLASAGLHGDKTVPPTPLGLQHVLWYLVGHISSSESHAVQRGCLEALHTLCLVFPPASLPKAWACLHQTPSLLPTCVSLLTASHLAWTVQGQQLLLDVCSAVFLACSLSTMNREAQSGHAPSASCWAALGGSDLVSVASLLLCHVARLLAVFVHVIEAREPEARDSRRGPAVSPMKSPGRETSPVRTTPTKPKVQIIEGLQRPVLVPRDGIGQFASIHHYLKILDACRSAYTNYQVSLAAVGEDKFSHLLQSVHNMAATLLEVALAVDVGKHVEELMTYFTYTFKVDPSGALLCVQQLLNALFGMNAAAQHTFMHSPYLSSLTFELSPVQRGTTPLPSQDHILTHVTVTQPLGALETWLEGPPPHLHLSPSSPSPPLPRKRGLFPSRRALVVKPVNPVSSVKDYIGYFEPLVVNVVKRFPHSSTNLLQQRTLFLLVQLLQLKVRYELLDCNHTFLESVLKLVGLMESGVVRDGQDLVPYIFQFLVLLAYDNSKVVSIPQVMQRCDGVMASGHSVDTFAIPALQPLVLNMFVRPGKEGAELDTQREVVLNMLLRVVDHSRVLSLLTHVLDCFSRSSKHWHRVSGQILAALLNAVARLSLVLDSADSLATLYHLFSAMDPSAISMKAMFVALLKQPQLKDVQQLCRWMAILNTALTLMLTLFPDSTLYSQLSYLSLTVPGVSCEMVEVEGHQPLTEATPTNLAWFILGALRVTAEMECHVQRQPGPHPQPLLPQLLGHCLLLLTSLLSSGTYESLRTALTTLTFPPSLASAFLSLTISYPLLALHYCQLALLTGGHSWVLSVLEQHAHSTAPSHLLIYHCLLPLVTGSTHSERGGGGGGGGGGEDKKRAAVGQLLEADLCTPLECMNALQVAKDDGSVIALRLLCQHLVCHPLSAISSSAVALARRLVADNTVTSDLASQLLPLLPDHSHKCSQLISELQRLVEPIGAFSQPLLPSTPSHPLQSSVSVHTVTRLWYLSEVYDLCSQSSEAWLCGRVLATLSATELSDLMLSRDFNKGLLEVCVCRGLGLSLPPVAGRAVSPQGPHPLLQSSRAVLVQRATGDPSDSSLMPALLWLLLSQQLLLSPSLDQQTACAVLDVILCSLKQADSPASLQTALDGLSVALALPEVEGCVGEVWLAAVIPLVAALLDRDGVEPSGPGQAGQQLHSALSDCLKARQEPPLGLHIETALLSLARLPSLHISTLTPPLLLAPSSSDQPSEQVLDQALREGEVLQQYMSRSNCVGWLTRVQFEERWMQLLGVVNQPPPTEGMPPEEIYAHTLNMCVGVVGVVSLLLSTCLRPEPGNPVSGVAMHTHRNRDILFLGTKPGRRLSMVRSVVERHLLLQCGARGNVYSYYQCPLLAHLSLPLYTRNVERSPGDTGLHCGQMSLKSLWPVTLLDPTSSSARSSPEGVDVKSCVLSLVDLFTHWLSQPLHSLLLLQTLRAILMLSDLFSLASQFEWMLQLACDLSDKQPSEDTAVHSLLIHGLLKAAAVVKVDGQQVERIVRLTEKALAAESVHVQNGCLCGLLYVAEDPTSQLAAHLGPLQARYLLPQLQAFHRNTEQHSHLCWSLAVSLALHHSHLLKDAEFPGQLLEKAIPLLLHPHTSTHLFHSLCLGLELMVVNFTLSAEQRSKVTGIAASRCAKCDLDKLLPALGLLVCCMYTVVYSGEYGSSESEETESELSIQTREHVSVLMEHLRHGPMEGVRFLVDVVPVLITDFFPPVQVLQMVVTEFVSPHQPRPSLAAVVMGETLSLLLTRNMGDLVTDWVLLSLDSFVQQEPENKAVWCLVCLLTAASPSSILRAMLEVVAAQPGMTLSRSRALLATASSHFYCSQASPQQQQMFIEKFLSSSYPTLNAVAHACLHSV